jgi:hypothetical protein
VAELTQAECSGSPLDNRNEQVSFTPSKGKVDIDYQEAHFRCAQDVEGFFRTTGSGIDVLVQPVDMNPDSVARCDCLYDITILLDPVTPGQHAVAVYRRWDNINEDNEPVRIGGETVQVE